METLTSAGEVILVFQVMPYYGTMMAFALMFSLGFIPSLCKLLFSHYSRHMKTGIKAAKIFFDLMAFLVQAIGIGYPIVLKLYLHYNENGHTHASKGQNEELYNNTTVHNDQWHDRKVGSLQWQVCD